MSQTLESPACSVSSQNDPILPGSEDAEDSSFQFEFQWRPSNGASSAYEPDVAIARETVGPTRGSHTTASPSPPPSPSFVKAILDAHVVQTERQTQPKEPRQPASVSSTAAATENASLLGASYTEDSQSTQLPANEREETQIGSCSLQLPPTSQIPSLPASPLPPPYELSPMRPNDAEEENHQQEDEEEQQKRILEKQVANEEIVGTQQSTEEDKTRSRSSYIKERKSDRWLFPLNQLGLDTHRYAMLGGADQPVLTRSQRRRNDLSKLFCEVSDVLSELGVASSLLESDPWLCDFLGFARAKRPQSSSRKRCHNSHKTNDPDSGHNNNNNNRNKRKKTREKSKENKDIKKSNGRGGKGNKSGRGKRPGNRN